MIILQHVHYKIHDEVRKNDKVHNSFYNTSFGWIYFRNSISRRGEEVDTISRRGGGVDTISRRGGVVDTISRRGGGVDTKSILAYVAHLSSIEKAITIMENMCKEQIKQLFGV